MKVWKRLVKKLLREQKVILNVVCDESNLQNTERASISLLGLRRTRLETSVG